MSTQPTNTTPATPRPETATRSLWRALARTAVLATLLTLALSATASAGTYVIENCPAAPAANSNAGAWTIFGSPQTDQATCSGGAGAYIGPLGTSMAPDTTAGVTIDVPDGSGITIRQANVWWEVPQASGATNFAIAATSAGAVQQAQTPLNNTSTPDQFTLPSTTTSLTLADYCSSDDGPTGCSFGAGENQILELLGAQLTLEDSTLPSGSATGGALAASGPLKGTQALAYSVADASSGVRLVKLLIDGTPVAENDYSERCPYENFLACPASISDTINWNTATVTDGQHSLEAIVQNAAQNTTVFYTSTITTNNAPTNTTPPTITPSQATIGTPLTAEPGSWSTPTGAGPLTYRYQWQDCNTEGNNCQAIPGGQTATYTPTASDAGHTLRALVTAADNDGATPATSSTTTAVLSIENRLGALPGPGTSTPINAGTSTTTTTTGGGTPNGTPATATASLYLAGPGTIVRSFARRALRLTGHLADSQSQPIAGAILEVLQQIAGTNTLTLIGHATTSPTGTFALTVPAGPSRLIEIAYRALSTDTSYTATAEVHETVRASAQLEITTLTQGPTGTIEISGKVAGPVPPQGTIVELLVHYLGHWEPFRDPRTNSHGHFHVEYQFQDAIGRFPFRIKIPAGQANYPYTSGYSNVVPVYTN